MKVSDAQAELPVSHGEPMFERRHPILELPAKRLATAFDLAIKFALKAHDLGGQLFDTMRHAGSCVARAGTSGRVRIGLT
jgi:hypothetical protein